MPSGTPATVASDGGPTATSPAETLATCECPDRSAEGLASIDLDAIILLIETECVTWKAIHYPNHDPDVAHALFADTFHSEPSDKVFSFQILQFSRFCSFPDFYLSFRI
jgi:hypothetical protein